MLELSLGDNIPVGLKEPAEKALEALMPRLGGLISHLLFFGLACFGIPFYIYERAPHRGRHLLMIIGCLFTVSGAYSYITGDWVIAGLTFLVIICLLSLDLYVQIFRECIIACLMAQIKGFFICVHLLKAVFGRQWLRLPTDLQLKINSFIRFLKKNSSILPDRGLSYEVRLEIAHCP